MRRPLHHPPAGIIRVQTPEEARRAALEAWGEQLADNVLQGRKAITENAEAIPDQEASS